MFKFKQYYYIPAIAIASLLFAWAYKNITEHSKSLSFIFLAFFTFLLLFFTAARHRRLTAVEKLVHFKNYTLEVILNATNIFMNLDENEGHYEFILTAAIEVIPNGHKGSFLILNPLTNRYEFKACHGYDLKGLQTVSFLLEETFLYQNAKDPLNIDQPVIVRDVRVHDSKFLDPNVNSNIENAGGLDIREALSAPILIDGKIMGILNIDSMKSDAFTEADRQLIHFFAKQIAMALKHKQLIDETVLLNRHDKLTGAYNRDYFEKIFAAQRSRTLENLETYALILCDLDNLKKVNDSYGHTAGDQLLTEFSKHIRSTLTEHDVFARIGGDEFILLFRNLNESQAHMRMKNIYNGLKEKSLTYHGHQIPISFSYGVAISPDDSMIYDILVKIADERMYAFKSQNKKLPF